MDPSRRRRSSFSSSARRRVFRFFADVWRTRGLGAGSGPCLSKARSASTWGSGVPPASSCSKRRRNAARYWRIVDGAQRP